MIVVLILNTDIAILDNVFDKMYRYMEANSNVALVGPKLKNPDGSVQMSCMRYPTTFMPIYRRTFLGRIPWARTAISSYLMEDFNHNEIREVDWILGSCELVRRSAIDKVGGMDEDFFMYFGDVAWCQKFHTAGFKIIYFPEGDIIHYHKRESAQGGILSKIFWIHISDWIKYLKKYPQKNAV